MAELDAYYTTFGWMSSDEALGLKGSELQAYALVHSYSRNKGGCYFGSLETTSQICGFTRGTAKSAFKSLVEKGLLIKRKAVIDGENRCIYTAVPWGGSKIDPGQNLPQGGSKIAPGGGSKIDPYNKDIDNKSITKGKGTHPPLILPFDSERFRSKWEDLLQNWKECLEPRELRKKTPRALQSLLNSLGKYHEDFAIELMERCIEGGWRGVVFKDTDEKYQEWKSARQLKIDNAVPRISGNPTQAFTPLPENSRVGDMYRNLQKQKEEEERQMREEIERYKREYGYTD